MAVIKPTTTTIYFGTKRVVELYIGDTKIWPSAYLDVTPKYLWLMPGNNFTDDADVLSNVSWNVT